MSPTESEYVERATLDFVNASEKFSQEVADYSKQYCSIYLVRLKRMRDLLSSKINERWKDKYRLVKLHKLSEENEKCVVIGTLFKDQKLKPSVLKQLSEGNQLVPQPVLNHFTDESDALFIEDELQRLRVVGNISCKKLVTGIGCALLGRDIGNGKFEVQDYVFVDYRPQIERPLLERDVYVVFLSGIDFVNIQNSSNHLQMFINWINGLVELNDVPTEQIARVIIAGNSVRTSSNATKLTISMTARTVESSDTIEAVKLFDVFLHELAQVIDVDVMPGEHDPSNHILPQKPMHFCMFPNANMFKSLNQRPNPFSCCLNGVKIMGSSGQPVRDIMRFAEITDPLEALENCLNWCHLAPTAPDTLGCYPYYAEDPFIIDECPHVFFAGNQENFATKIATGNNGQNVRLIAIPEFSQKFQVCVLNLKNLECSSLVFNSF